MIRYVPAAPLSRYVEFFWWSRREVPQEYCEHMLPSGKVQLVFALHEVPIVCWPKASSKNRLTWSGSLVHGPQWSYYVTGPKPRGAVVGVSFRPGAAGAVLGVTMTELADHHVSLSTLWGCRGQTLHERLIAATDPMAAFRILEEQLSARIQRPLLMHPVVAHALTYRWRGGITQVQRDAGYSPRHFIALFRAAVGMTPKHYFRIQRFNDVLGCLAAQSGAGLADIAASVGYSDQAHLTREFHALAGVTPRRYHPVDSGSPLHHRALDLLK